MTSAGKDVASHFRAWSEEQPKSTSLKLQELSCLNGLKIILVPNRGSSYRMDNRRIPQYQHTKSEHLLIRSTLSASPSKSKFRHIDCGLRGTLETKIPPRSHTSFLKRFLQKSWEKSNNEVPASTYSAATEHVHLQFNNRKKKIEIQIVGLGGRAVYLLVTWPISDMPLHQRINRYTSGYSAYVALTVALLAEMQQYFTISLCRTKRRLAELIMCAYNLFFFAQECGGV